MSERDKNMVVEFLQSVENLQDAIVQYQIKLDQLQDWGQRIRSMVEDIRPIASSLSDPGVIRLPRGIVPHHNRAALGGNDGHEDGNSEESTERKAALQGQGG